MLQCQLRAAGSALDRAVRGAVPARVPGAQLRVEVSLRYMYIPNICMYIQSNQIKSNEILSEQFFQHVHSRAMENMCTCNGKYVHVQWMQWNMCTYNAICNAICAHAM